jgi:hypothetical protein
LAEDDAHLWLWGVNRLMGAAYDVVAAWGFTPMSLLTWCKPGPGMGYYLRNNTEHCIFATRGRPIVPSEAVMSSWYQWPRLRHSEKPAEFFDVVERVSPGPYLELFARGRRHGWDAWGDEVPDGSPRCACGHPHIVSLGDDGADAGCSEIARGCDCWAWRTPDFCMSPEHHDEWMADLRACGCDVPPESVAS